MGDGRLRIAVTGANGFVGRHLTRALSESGDVVAVVRPAVRLADFSDVRTVGDIGSESQWYQALDGVDAVVHLAARVHVMRETSSDPLADFRKVNTVGTQALGTAAARRGVRRLVFLSSVKVHGEGRSGHPYSVADDPSPVDPYGVSKWEAEQALMDIANGSDTSVSVLRSTVVYGAGVKGNIERIARLVKSGIPLPFGLVGNRRSMLAISNLSHWVTQAVCDQRRENVTALMSDPEPISTQALVTHIAEGIGRKPRLIPVPVGLMTGVARTVGGGALADRLFGDLEVAPTFSAYPGIQEVLSSPAQELREFGRQFGAKGGAS